MFSGLRTVEKWARKAAGAEASARMRDQKLHAAVARNTFRSEKTESTSRPEHFGSRDVKKAHAVVARSTLRSQNVKDTVGLEHFSLTWPNFFVACAVLYTDRVERSQNAFVQATHSTFLSHHFSVHQWGRSAIHASRQLTHLSYRFPIFGASVIGFCGCHHALLES